MADNEEVPDFVPEDWGDEAREITVSLTKNETCLLQATLFRLGLEHLNHDCDVELIADELLEKVGNAVESQVFGR